MMYYTSPDTQIYELQFRDGSVKKRCTYKNGLLHGDCHEYYKNGSLKFKCQYENGNLHEWSCRYNINAQIQRQTRYRHGAIVCDIIHTEFEQIHKVITPRQNQHIEQPIAQAHLSTESARTFSPVGCCKKDLQYLVETKVYYTSGQLKRTYTQMVSNYNLKKPDVGKQGECITYYPNGQIQLYEMYIDNVLDGHRIEYTEEGDLHQIVQYSRGVRNGLHICLRSGIVWMHEEFKNNVPHGFRYSYDLQGTLEYKLQYVEGSRHGDQYSYYPSGAIKRKYYYANSVMTGLWTEFAEDGSVLEQRLYKNSDTYITIRPSVL